MFKSKCSKTRNDPNKKPSDTKTKTYTWSEIKGNPNLYCWLPVSKKDVNLDIIDLDTVSIQDIPLPPDYSDMVSGISELVESEMETIFDKNLKEGTDIVSADDPRKYSIVKDFIVNKGLKLYGGAAINMYLPKEEKIYGTHVVPDYDVYSPDPWNNALELVKILYKNGFKYTEVRAGVHKGTYKVYANFWPVADITYMPKELFNRMKTRTINKFKVVSPSHLISNMYKELSLPSGEVSRWPKVASRLKLVELWANPIKENMVCSPKTIQSNELINTLLDRSFEFIQKKKLLITGVQAYNTYIMIGGGDKLIPVEYYESLSENAHTDIQELLTTLLKIVNDPKRLIITTNVIISLQHNNTVYSIVLTDGEKLIPICYISQLSVCVPYKKILDQNVVSIDYLKYTLFNQAVFGDENEVKDVKCMLKYLNKVQNYYYKSKKVSEFEDTPFQRFVIKCKGPAYNNLKQIVFEKWLENEKQQKNREKGISSIPKECKNLTKKNCDYPCAWNEESKKCAVPPNVYRVKE